MRGAAPQCARSLPLRPICGVGGGGGGSGVGGSRGGWRWVILELS